MYHVIYLGNSLDTFKYTINPAIYSAEIPQNSRMADITTLGSTNWRDQRNIFGIKDQDRFGHIYVIGKTGVGKSTLLLNMAISDIEKGKGICVIDPHGDLAETLLEYIPAERKEDVIYFNPQDSEFPIAFNPFFDVPPHSRHLVVSGIISTFKKIWLDSWGPRLEYILRFCILTLLEYPEATLLDIQPLLTDIYFRNTVLDHVTNKHVIDFWKQEFEKYPQTLRAEMIAPILNKTGVFLANIPLRNIVGQKTRGLDIGAIVNEGKILIANLAKGLIGEDACSILGSVLITAIQLAVTARSNQDEHKRTPFFLYVDEMHSFISLSFADILAEARKYKLSLFLTHQYIEQISETIRSAVFGNVGTLISFRVGATDAAYLAKEFRPIFSETDFVNLPKYTMYIKLMIDGATSKGFSAETLPLKKSSISYKEKIKELSRKWYGRNKDQVEAEIFERRSYKSPDDADRNLFSQ